MPRKSFKEVAQAAQNAEETAPSVEEEAAKAAVVEEPAQVPAAVSKNLPSTYVQEAGAEGEFGVEDLRTPRISIYQPISSGDWPGNPGEVFLDKTMNLGTSFKFYVVSVRKSYQEEVDFNSSEEFGRNFNTVDEVTEAGLGIGWDAPQYERAFPRLDVTLLIAYDGEDEAVIANAVDEIDGVHLVPAVVTLTKTGWSAAQYLITRYNLQLRKDWTKAQFLFDSRKASGKGFYKPTVKLIGKPSDEIAEVIRMFQGA
jgi:hypothetical protein